jgi:hypothetical protein
MPQLDRYRSLFSGLGGSPAVTTMWFDPAEGLNPQDLSDRVAAFWLEFNTILANNLSIQVDSIVDSVDSDTGEVTSSTGVTPHAAIAGGNGSDALPWADQVLVQLRTGVRFGGRELRGRMFIPGFTEEAINDGQVHPTTAAAVQSAAQDLADEADQVVYSPTKREFADVSTTDVWNQFAVLRSRRD